MRIIVCFLLSAFCCSPVFAAVDGKIVSAAEKYLNGITGFSGGFTQTANGRKDGGTFSMLRPGRIRLDYDSVPVQLISNGKDLYFYDKSLDQITTVPLTSTPAGILVRRNINLTTADIVVSETDSTPDSFSLKMHIRGNEGAGFMKVDFHSSPVKLKSWVVHDATGMDTKVVFGNMKTKTDFPKNYFQLQRHKATSNSGGDIFYE
ncbi:MAG: outer membrane lipoprotein carrier protein LolA [Rickettsiales bacterium]|jgi:outer membrane lipoprotein-sorting protein|nr:outer membrane lipoprotein carrier protein LolA [Rickettsiales bacterium]